MGKLKILLGIVTLLAIFSFAWTGVLNAQNFYSGKNVSVSENQPINNTVFAYGNTVDIQSNVNGDVFCAGQTVSISGTVRGDVICAGQTVHITGTVNGNVRLIGQDVTLGAPVSGSATIAAQSFTLESKGKVGGDMSVASSSANVNGPVGRDIAAGGGTVTIASTVGRNVQGNMQQLKFAPGAQINGNVDFTSANSLVKANGATVTGTVTRSEPKKPSTPTKGTLFALGMGLLIYSFLAMLVTALVIALLFPRPLHAVTNKAMPRPWKALLIGFLASIVVPVVLLILTATIIGLPLALILGLLWLLILLLSGPISGYYLGRLILRRSQKPLLIMLVGATVLLLLYFVPVIGFIVLLASMWIGTGALLLAAFQNTPKPAYNLDRVTAEEEDQKFGALP